ncbi:amidase signature domain-containing protein [Durotheca rogersii]|uniref:amidase signature domain-containing protein n=1 Tax=Durotheca rogersii TaxID=419775 RepID=UPI0022205B14|nr:amidase signature domain-containing protein [Durotheca rogersii]KAI5865241.1 amidase signature domain-containing protein [Durotheca rogersii]
MSQSTIRETWQSISARKQAERASKIPSEWLIPEALMPSDEEDRVQEFPYTSGFFTKRELLITDSTASEVVSKVAAGEWTAVEVIKATCKRAAVAQQLVNCVTETYFDQALIRATELDEHLQTKGETVGPLHGLPVSLKDQFNLKGVDSTIGYAAWAGKKPEEESTLVRLLRNAGAVFYVKTNVPTTLMTGETVNNLFGRTSNPRNRKLTSGGSSGGESALIALRGSFIGVGTDIGGSIRHPASFLGLYALRPSHGRVSYQQVTNTFLGQEAVRSCAGPMCRSPEDIRLFMASVAAQKPWEHDPQIIPLPWRADAEVLPEKLCFGFGMGDGYVNPSPPLRRAMEITRDKLLAAGHRIIDFIPYESKEASEIIWKMWLADGAEEIRRDSGLTGEPLPPGVEMMYGHSNASLKPLSVFESWQNQHRRTVLAQRFLERWQKTAEVTGTGRPIDALITPNSVTPAARHSMGQPWNYGALSPLLDLTTGVFPVTEVDLVKDVIPGDWKPISEKDREAMEFYERPENHENAQVGLALIGRRLEEEKITAMLKVMKEVVGFHVG